MQQADSVIMGWRHGSESVAGHKNPAGPLYIQGEEATAAALTASTDVNVATVTCSSCSFSVVNGVRCLCC